jgi:hypothetical protein
MAGRPRRDLRVLDCPSLASRNRANVRIRVRLSNSDVASVGSAFFTERYHL